MTTIDVHTKTSILYDALKNYQSQVSYICNAVCFVAGDCDWSLGRKFSVMGESTFQTLKNAYPEAFNEDSQGKSFIIGWLKLNNLPNQLRKKAYRRSEACEYRIALLKWIIAKYGDRDLTFRAQYHCE